VNRSAGAGWPPAAPGALARLGASLAAAVAVVAGRILIGLRLKRPPEGWRRTVGVLLRSEPTRFALSAFGLRVPSDATLDATGTPPEARVARALATFLSGERDAHFALEWRRPVTIRRPIPFVDVVILRFAADGSLARIEPFLAAGVASVAAPEVRARVREVLVRAYNRTAHLPEVERTRAIREQIRTGLGPPGPASAHARRLLAASCLSFDDRDLADPARRFCPPAFAARRPLGFGYLSWIARLDPAGPTVDLWVSAHHVGLDGVPLQDLLGRLEQAWGTDPVEFPAASNGETFAGPHACNAPGERPVDQLITFVDFTPVLELRRLLNARWGPDLGGEVTFGALLAWLVGQEPEFAGVRIASTVDIAASGGYERDVDVVPLRPADYTCGTGPWDGFLEFSREFNRLIAASRARASPLRVGMRTAGLLPAWAHSVVVRSNPAALDDTFGSLCITIIREGRVFIAPMTDLGLGHGFIAIGSADLPSASGGRVACVSVKGESGRVTNYPAILQRVIARSARLQAEIPGRVAGGGGLLI
jgi:hypothetical protein